MTDSGRIYDELLVLSVRAGDRAALERLAARWQPRLLRTARRMLGDPELARESVQDSWIGIVSGIGRLTDARRFPAWAFAILHRRCADRIGREVRRRERSGEAGPGDEPRLESGAEERVAIAHAFAALPPEQRVTATLFFVEQLTLGEIAEATGSPLGTVKSRLFTARKSLKEHLKGDLT